MGIAYIVTVSSSADAAYQRIVLGILVSSVVAVAELGLYLIWESRARTDKPSATRLRPRQNTSTRDKKVDDDAEVETESSVIDSPQPEGVSSAVVGLNLRQRPATSAE